MRTLKTRTTISALALGLTFSGLGTSALFAAEATRSFQQPFPAAGEVRLGNLAGHVDLVRGQGTGVVVEATVHADFGNAAETQRLLQGMKWVKSQDKKGREEWVLSYPVEKYRSFTYPISNEDSGIPSWLSFLSLGSNTNTTYRGERVRIYTLKGSSAPTLYADLRITLPAGANVAVRNAVGKVRGGDLEGTLSIDTGSGDVQVQDGEAGRVIAKTGSGGVQVLSVELEDLTAETGSGNVTVRSSLARTKRLSAETGSGDVDISAGPNASFDVVSDQGSGDLNVHYADAVLRKSGHKVVGAKRGDGRTAIHIETGSGDATIRPKG
jgi:hypothetical protein